MLLYIYLTYSLFVFEVCRVVRGFDGSGLEEDGIAAGWRCPA